MRAQSKGFCETFFVKMGLMVIASILLVSFSGSFTSAYVVPQASDADAMGDGRIEILRRSGADGEGMDEALKYLEELDKYYAQVARPRFGKRSSPPHLRKMARLLRTRIPIEMIYGGL